MHCLFVGYPKSQGKKLYRHKVYCDSCANSQGQQIKTQRKAYMGSSRSFPNLVGLLGCPILTRNILQCHPHMAFGVCDLLLQVAQCAGHFTLKIIQSVFTKACSLHWPMLVRWQFLTLPGVSGKISHPAVWGFDSFWSNHGSRASQIDSMAVAQADCQDLLAWRSNINQFLPIQNSNWKFHQIPLDPLHVLHSKCTPNSH